jgi:glycosyltransferase involved in cell wall biosynthesis
MEVAMRICLNMIVKNEAAVIARCLASVKPWITHWVIVDTGSTDGTQDIIRDFMRDLPGELHEREWHNFAHNRNEALALAKSRGDYILFIDADETLQMPPTYRWPALSADGYRLRIEYLGWHYLRGLLISARVSWQWVGVLHEYLECAHPAEWQVLAGPEVCVTHDGARGQNPETYLRDIEVLERAVREDPTNHRNVFYLAQSYRDAGRSEPNNVARRNEQAINRYQQRAAMGGWDEELWFSVYQIALLSEAIGLAPAEISARYLAAYAMRPTRAEPLCELARFYRLRGEHALAHVYARQATTIPYPQDTLLINTAIYTWRALDELAVSAYFVKTSAAQIEGRSALEKLWLEQKFPASERDRILANRVFYGLGAV